MRRRERVRWLTFLGIAAILGCTAQAATPSKLVVTTHGAAGEVSGSLHVLDTGAGRFMIDCGAMMEKGEPGERSHARGYDASPRDGDRPTKPVVGRDDPPQTLPPGVETVDAVFLTHAHVDHLGRLPLLTDHGFRGPIYMTEATRELALPMLRVLLRADRTTSRHWSWSKSFRARAESGGKTLWLHWRDCEYRMEIAAKNVEEADGSARQLIERFAGQTPRVKAIVCEKCIDEEARAILRQAKTVRYGAPINVAPGVRATFLDAGHIPGAASILFDVTLRGDVKRRVLFSGDLGNDLSPLEAAPRPAPKVDAVWVETTYGPIHRKESVRRQPERFRREVAKVVEKKGVAWIPCFSMDRTQKILYELHVAQRDGLLPKRLPIFCPSPTAREVTALYAKHRRSGWFPPGVARDGAAFAPRDVRATVPWAGQLPRPCVIISTSDLMLAPWMRRLLTSLLPEESTHLFLVGYQDPDTAGKRLLHGATRLEIDGATVPIRAKVHSFSCFSGHADAGEVDAWLADVPNDATVVLVHGDPAELAARAEQLRAQGRRRVVIAEPGKPIDLQPGEHDSPH